MSANLVVDETVRKVQLKCLEMLIELKRICDKHDIKYFLIGGTALGAYRHKGFIPWDDDIDVGMPRKEYERFINICKSELNDKYFLQTPTSEKIFVFPFTKIRMNNTIYREKAVEKQNIHHGIFIDIFPLDIQPTNKLLQIVQKNILTLTNKIRFIKVSGDHHNFLKKVSKNIIGKCYPSNLIRMQYDFVLNLGRNSRQIKYGNMLGPYEYGKEIMSKEIFGEGIYLEFEGHYFCVPEKIETFLRQMYGETFNQLPPIEKRINHKPVEIRGI